MFIPGIGEKTEENFWKKGILTWLDLKKNFTVLSRVKRKVVCDYLTEADSALSEYNTSFFVRHLPQKEYWRIYSEFRNKTLFLDIETTGLSLYYDKITLVGTFDGNEYKIFVRDNNLPDFIDYLENYELIVTFNGKLFDIPFIKKEFPEIEIPPLHIDLRYLLRGLGITGSLKQIEGGLGIRRPKNLQEINGREASVLWNKFVRGDNKALEKLILYNFQDTVNLQTIMHFCYKAKVKEIESKINCDSYQPTLFSYGKEVNTCFETYNFEMPPSNLNIPKLAIQHFGNGLLNVRLNNENLVTINRNKIKKLDIKIEGLLQRIKSKGLSPISVGIDLSGSGKRKSGICVLKGKEAYLDVARTDEDILSKTINAKPTVISIDSPLSLPEGRCCPEDSCECRKYGITRECERILKKRGINVYPCLIGSMQNLTMRGIRLADTFQKQGFEVIESYPGAAQDIMGFPRKRIDLDELEIDLMNMGIKPVSGRETVTHDEIDALTSALVGYFYLAGNYEAIGKAEEGYLIIPDLTNGG